MDVKGFDAWTREALESEARKRGIVDPELRPRRELIRLIVRSGYSRAVNQGARRLARGLKGFAEAREVLNIALETAADLSSRLPLPGRTGRTLVGMPAPATLERAPKTEPNPQAPPGDAPERAVTTAAGTHDEAPAASEAAAATAQRASAEPPAASADAPAAPTRSEPSAPRASSATRDGQRDAAPGFADEPIRTHSMARLLAAQGHTERAIAIYEELAAQNSESGELRDELSALRRGEGPAQPEPRLPTPAEVRLPDTGDRIHFALENGRDLKLTWTVSDAGMARARAVLGQAGELAVRLVRICPDPEHIVRSEVTDHGPVLANGSWSTDGAGAGERWVAAVGVRTGERFVSIAHARA